MIKSFCGMKCEICLEYSYRCPGCDKISGKPLWASELEYGICPLYMCCVVKKQLSCCSECQEFHCQVNYKLATSFE